MATRTRTRKAADPQEDAVEVEAVPTETVEVEAAAPAPEPTPAPEPAPAPAPKKVTPQAAQASGPKKLTLQALRNHEGTLYIKNNTPHHMSFHQRIGEGSVDFELSPVGTPNSAAHLPKLALEMRGLQKLWLRGSITVSADEDMEDHIQLLMGQSIQATEAQMANLRGEVTAPNTGKDLVEKACLQCGATDPNSGVVTRGRVFQSAREIKDGVAPLCADHADMAALFPGSLTSDAQGNETWTFATTTVTAPRIGAK